MAQSTTKTVTTYIAQQWPWKTKFSVDVLRLHQKWGMLSNVMDFYNYNGKYLEWYASYEKENQEFLQLNDEKQQLLRLAVEKEIELLELENSIPQCGPWDFRPRRTRIDFN